MTTAESEPGKPSQDWFLRDWLAARKKKQADIIRELGWDRARVSRLVTGRQPYTRDDVNFLAAWLGIDAFELLMEPAQALALRRVREAAQLIAAEPAREFEYESSTPGRSKVEN